jgi:hypothetical protein
VSAVGIRPFMPDLHPSRYLLDPRRGFDRCALIVVREVGTAGWLSDGFPQHRVNLLLGDGPGQLTAVVRASYPQNFRVPIPVGRLLLVDSAGRVLGRSRLLSYDLLHETWPDAVLEASGLQVREAQFKNTRLVQKAHRGAAWSWPFTAGYCWMALAILVLFGLLALLVVLTGWSA